MRPVSPAFQAAIIADHTVATRVEVLTAGTVVQTIDTMIDGTVTLDAKSAVRGRLALSIVDDGTLGLVPTTAASLLAPYGNELRVSRGIRYPDGSTELVGLGVFRIDDADIDDTPGGLVIQIDGQDRAAGIIDARFETPYEIAQGTAVETAIKDTIRAARPDIICNFAATGHTTPHLVAEEGSDRWKLCTDLADGAARRLYFDGDGELTLAPQTSGATAVLTLAEGENGLLLTVARKWSRAGAFNRVIATGENTGESAPVRGVATDDSPSSPTYYYGSFGPVPRFFVSQFLRTGTQAADAAAAILYRELGTTQSVTFGSVVNPALEPGDVLQITRLRAGVDELNILDTLTIPLAAQTGMGGTTRATLVVA